MQSRTMAAGNATPAGGPGERLRRALLLLVPALVAFAAHSPSLSHGFFGDDFWIILRNPQITGAASTKDVLASDWFDGGEGGAIGYYRPATKASFRLTWLLAGGSPFAFHLGSVLGHVAATLFLTLLLARLVPPWAAVAGASLWGVHPATVQSVQHVAARSDVLAAAFFLCALFLVAHWARTSRPAWLAAAMLAALLAVGSKESAVLLPVAAGALSVALGLPLRRSLAAAAATGIPVVAFFAVRLSVVRVAPLSNSLAELGPGLRIASVLEAVRVYAVSLLSGRPILRLPQVPESFLEPGVVVGALCSAALLSVLLATRLRSTAAFGIVAFGASLAPALAVWHLRIPMWRGEVPVADRWLYLPAAGAAVLGATVLARLPARAGSLAGAALAAAFALVTWQLSPAYASADAYNDWAADAFLASPPRNPREAYLARFYRARRLRDQRRNAEAFAELASADRIAPWLPDHHWQMAEVELALGRPADAAARLERLLSPQFRFDPRGVSQRIAMGNDSVARIEGADLWRFLARARDAAGDATGARDARAAAAESDRASDARLRRPRPGPPPAAR